ncbi:outer membrane beta-barrel protein [Gymnodinialimonas sp. 2305UL16-5]|uniref:outer membrane protein n=1 Tax=Gymnodinialimonas mytili TaxID=3126503 RepID=UPI0030AD71A8
MNRYLLPFIAMAFSSPAIAQVTGPAHSDWEGFYIGAQLDFLPSTEITFDNLPGLTGELEGVHLGGFIGYRRQFNALVVGGELDLSGGDVDNTITFGGLSSDGESQTALNRLGVEAGYDAGRFLPYGTVGLASLTFQNTINGDNRSFGTFAGIGLDYQTGQYTSVGVELLRHSFSNFSESDDLNVDIITLGVNFAVRY